jgi:AcrR family transcriptional regulator
LARAAKVSPSTLYVYFDDRDDLIFQLFRDEMAKLTGHIMDGFAPGMPFAEGLRVQWKNRIRYALAHPLQSDFLEHIRYSPYHERFMVRMPIGLFQAMRNFVVGAWQRGELTRLPVEVYWSIAFAPLYQLLKFHRSGFGVPVKPGPPRQARFVLTDEVVDLALGIVARGLKPVGPVGTPSFSTPC